MSVHICGKECNYEYKNGCFEIKCGKQKYIVAVPSPTVKISVKKIPKKGLFLVEFGEPIVLMPGSGTSVKVNVYYDEAIMIGDRVATVIECKKPKLTYIKSLKAIGYYLKAGDGDFKIVLKNSSQSVVKVYGVVIPGVFVKSVRGTVVVEIYGKFVKYSEKKEMGEVILQRNFLLTDSPDFPFL